MTALAGWLCFLLALALWAAERRRRRKAEGEAARARAARWLAAWEAGQARRQTAQLAESFERILRPRRGGS